MKSKELKKTIKYFKKNKNLIIKTIIPVVIFCLLVTIIGILLPKPNDNITPSKRGYLFENRNPRFNVAFGSKENTDKSYVRFEAKTSDNPFEQKEQGFWDNVTQLFTRKQGIEFGLSEVKFSETDSEIGKKITEQIGSAIEQMEIDDVTTNTEVIEVGRLLGEDTDTQSKKTVINKNVYPGIDVEYQILEDLGLKEEIVIRNIDEYTSNCGDGSECLLPLNEFVFDLNLDEGLQLKQSMANIDGKIENTYYITDEDDNYFAHFLPTFAVDEAGSRTSGVDLDISDGEENNYKVSVTLDLDWLFDNKRVFPIRIDPSIVHDTTTEFDTGTDYNTEVITGPKVQLEDPEVYYTDSNVVGYWKMDDNVTSVIPDDPDLEGYWDFQETSGTLYDKSGNSNNGTASGTTSTDGKIANGRSFNGSSDYVSVPTDTSLNITGDLTVETWIYPDDSLGTANTNRWLEKGDCYYLLEGNGTNLGTGITFAIKSSNTLTYVDSGVTESAGEWYHVVGVHDDSANLLRLYINGTQVNTTSFSGTIDNDNLALRIGSDDSGLYFDGLVDEVGIYSTALSPTEIEARYELGRNILDSSGNENHGLTMGSDYVEDGVLGGARSFNGTSDWVDLGNLGDPSAGTISFWLNLDSESINTQQYLLDGRGTGNWWFLYDYTTGACTDTEGNMCFNGLVEIPSNLLAGDTWYNVTVTLNSSQSQIFLDGRLIDTGSGLDPSFASVRIGTRYTNSSYLNGSIDEVLISNVVRSADEIKRLYQIGYEKMVQGAHTSAELDIGSTADVEAVSWTPVGDNTGDGETPYSTTGLVGQWNFNESSGTTADNVGSCGSSCDGTLSGFSSTSGQDVVVGSGWTSDNRRWGDGALMFDGSNDYVSTTETATDLGINGSASRTVEAWVYTQSFNNGGIFEMGTESVGEDFSLRTMTTENLWRAQFWGSDLDFTYESKGKWVYLAMTYDGSDIYVYADGLQVASLSINLNTTNTKNFSIGRWSSYYFDGVIDSLRLYSRALNSTEILSNYQSGNIEMKYRTSTDGSTWSSWKGGLESSVENFDTNEDEYTSLYDEDESGLVGYWSMDEDVGTTVNDVTSNSNNGTANGSTIVDGKYRNGRWFDGSNDYIEVPNDSSLQLTTTFSYSAWIYRNTDTGGWERLMAKANTSGLDYYMQIANDDKLHCGNHNSSATNNSRRSSISIPVGEWTYVACTLDSSLNWHVYINGQLKDGLQEGSRVAANVSTRNLQFGRLGSASTWYYTFQGKIDEFQLYDSTLSSEQIYDHWTKRSLIYPGNYTTLDMGTQTNSIDGNGSLEIKSAGSPVDDNTMGYWKMDDNIESIVPDDANLEAYWDLVESSGSGAYLLDKSGNGHHGTPTGTTYIDDKINGGRNFNGDDVITVPNDSSLAFERTDAFSIEAWFNTTNADVVDIVAKMDNSSPYRGYDLDLYQSKVWFQIVGTWDTSTIAVYTNSTFADGNWHHVVATYDGSSNASGVEIYVDGSPQATTTYLNNLSSTIVATTPITIGDRTGATGTEFNGDIDEVGIYSKELTSTEALLRYRAGLDIKDSSGHNYHGSSSYLPYIEGINNGARSFDGTNDQIEIKTNTGLGTTNVTLEAWVNLDSTSESGLIVDIGGGSNGYGMGIGASNWEDNGNDLILLFDMVRWIDTGYVVGTGWKHIVMTLDYNGKPSAYVNGELVYSDTGSNALSPSNYTYIGGYGTRYLDATIDEVRTSNIARTPEEIKDYYNFAKNEYIQKTIDLNNISSNTLLPFWIASDQLGNNIDMTYGESDYANYIPDEHTVGYWDMDEEEPGAQVSDLSGYGNDGVLNPNGFRYTRYDNACTTHPTTHTAMIACFNEGTLYDNSVMITSQTPTNIADDYTDMLSTWMYVTAPGTWYFAIDGDDAVEIEIDTTVVASYYDGHGFAGDQSHYGTISLDKGWHKVNIRHEEVGGGDGVVAYVRPPGVGTWSVFSTSSVSGYATLHQYSATNIEVQKANYIEGGLQGYPSGSFTEGVLGESRVFNGGEDYIEIPHTSTLSDEVFGTNDVFTLESWVYPRAWVSYGPIINKATSGSYSNTTNGIWSYSGGFRCEMGANVSGNPAGSHISVVYQPELNNWYHVVCAADGTDLMMYVNGQKVGSTSISGLTYTRTSNTAPVTIGRRAASYTWDSFDGMIDEVRISNIDRSADEIRQAYEVGRRTHPVKVSFKANLESSNLISSVSDTSFTINEQNYGASDYIENIDIGDKIIIKETYQGVEYIAQGDIATRNTSTGAVTVSSWDASSSFPSQGFTTAATVFKWQREYVDIRYPLDEDIDAITKLTFRKKTDTPAIFYIDDLKKATYSSDYDASEFGALGATTAVETQIDSFDQDYLYDTTASNLTAYYPMDETSGTGVDNVISSSYDGTASGTNVIDGKFNKGRRFDGSDDYVNIGSSLQPSLPVSISAWIYLENIGNTMGIFNNDKLYASAHNHSGIFINVTTAGILSVNYGDNTACSTTSRQTAETQEALQTGKWIHMVGILRGASDIDIYLDGIKQPVNYTGTGGSLSYASRNGAIGAVSNCSDGSTQPMDGSIDELEVYTRSLSSSEVWNLYKTGSTSPRSIRTTNISNRVEGTGAWEFNSDVYTVDPATVGLWHLDESSGSGAYLLDSSYNSYNGTPTGTTYVSAGKFNGARSFDGTGSDYITTSLDTEADSLYADTGNTWTVEAWFKHNGGLTEDGVIVGRGAGTGTSGHFGIFVDTSGNLRTVIRGAYTTITSSVADNSWHHVAVTWDGSIGRGYFDGSFQTELSIGTAGSQAYNVSIGAQRNGENFFYEGEIDEVRIANVPLPSNEISSAYNMGDDNYVTKTFDTSDLSDHATLPFWIASDNLGNNFDVIYGQDSYGLYEPDVYTEGLWHLDESSGSGAYLLDSSSNSNDATPSGTSYVTGRHNGARSFNGTSDYIDAGSSSTLRPTTEITVSAWVYADSGPGSEGRTAVSTVDWVSSSEAYGWNLGAVWTDSKFQFIVCDGGTMADHVVEDETFFTKYMGEWVHVTATFKSNEYIRLYENGELAVENTTSVPSTLAYNGMNMRIGSRSDASSYWDGMIDEVRISSKALSNSEVQAEYNRGSYTHNITVDFKADLQLANLISNSGDTSFTISEQAYGATNPIENLSTGDKIVVKETVSGTEYTAQGDVDTLSTSTGAVTVDAWDSGSTFPGSGFTTSSTVFKWQMEEIDISDFLTDGETDLDDLAFKKVSDVEGILWVDDLSKSTAAYNPDTTYLEGVQYVQYEAIFTKWDDNPYLDLYLSEVNIDYSSGPTMEQLMRHGKWFNSSGEQQPFWWVSGN
jgi:hypothetical protein